MCWRHYLMRRNIDLFETSVVPMNWNIISKYVTVLMLPTPQNLPFQYIWTTPRIAGLLGDTLCRRTWWYVLQAYLVTCLAGVLRDMSVKRASRHVLQSFCSAATVNTALLLPQTSVQEYRSRVVSDPRALSIFRGCLTNIPKLPTNTVRIFLSSTFSGCVH